MSPGMCMFRFVKSICREYSGLALECAKHPSSPTVEVLKLFLDENLGKVLRLIRDKLHRFDVIYQLQSALKALEQRRSKLTTSKAASCDSGLQSGSVSPRQSSRSETGHLMQLKVSVDARSSVNGEMPNPGLLKGALPPRSGASQAGTSAQNDIDGIGVESKGLHFDCSEKITLWSHNDSMQ